MGKFVQPVSVEKGASFIEEHENRCLVQQFPRKKCHPLCLWFSLIDGFCNSHAPIRNPFLRQLRPSYKNPFLSMEMQWKKENGSASSLSHFRYAPVPTISALSSRVSSGLPAMYLFTYPLFPRLEVVVSISHSRDGRLLMWCKSS